MVTYYVTLFASLLINYLPPHHFCLCGIYVTTYVTLTMTSLIVFNFIAEKSINHLRVDVTDSRGTRACAGLLQTLGLHIT